MSTENIPTGKSEGKPLFQLWIGIEAIEPPVFRRLQLRECTLAKLHEIIQLLFGWKDTEIHMFDVDGTQYSSDRKVLEPFGWESSHKVSIGQLFGQGVSEFGYTYDMADNWEVSIVNEGEVQPEPRVSYPRVVDGDRCGPPDGSGGARKFERLLQAWADSRDPNHATARQRLGPAFDPESFSIEDINTKLKRVRN